MVDNLTARQLSAGAEVVLTDNMRIGSDNNSFEEPSLELPSTDVETLVGCTKPKTPTFI